MSCDQSGFDPAEYLQLPGGSWVPRKGSPCPQCGPDADRWWEVVRYRKTVEADGRSMAVEVESCQCPNYFGHKRQERPRGLVILGKLDVLTGEFRPT